MQPAEAVVVDGERPAAAACDPPISSAARSRIAKDVAAVHSSLRGEKVSHSVAWTLAEACKSPGASVPSSSLSAAQSSLRAQQTWTEQLRLLEERKVRETDCLLRVVLLKLGVVDRAFEEKAGLRASALDDEARVIEALACPPPRKESACQQ